eukprot:11183861-Lingulodinium_polyedra.AAC.1
MQRADAVLHWAQGVLMPPVGGHVVVNGVAVHGECLWQEGEGANRARCALASFRFYAPQARATCTWRAASS